MSRVMRTAVLLEKKKFEIQNRPVPRPGPNEVLIRVRSVGVCGSDVHYFDGRRDKESQTVYPFILGHEYAGEVVEIGSDCSKTKTGARVVPSPLSPCGTCEWCTRQITNLCPNTRFTGSGGVEGALCEYFVTREKQLHYVPESVSFDHAIVVEPLAIALHIVETLIDPQPGLTYSIMGAGPIGLSIAFCLQEHSPSEIFVSEKIPERIEAATFYGATDAFDSSGGNAVEYILDRTGGRGVDVAIEAAGDLAAMTDAAYTACRGGTVVIEGIAEETMIPFDTQNARGKELKIIFGRRSRHKEEKAMSLIETGSFDTSRFVTHVFPLEEIQTAFELAGNYADGVIKTVINP